MKNSRASNMIEIGTGLWWYWGPPNNKISQGRKASWRKWAIGRQMGGEVRWEGRYRMPGNKEGSREDRKA